MYIMNSSNEVVCLRPFSTSFLSSASVGTHTTLAFAAISDLMVGLTAPFLAVSHGLRIVPPLLLHLKYVAKSHATSWYMQTAVDTVRLKLDSIFHHRRCPAPVSAAYVRCAGLAASAARLLAA